MKKLQYLALISLSSLVLSACTLNTPTPDQPSSPSSDAQVTPTVEYSKANTESELLQELNQMDDVDLGTDLTKLETELSQP